MSSPLDRIDHIVVLMLENRSFDNLLGWLYEPGQEPNGQSFDGVAGKELSNPIPTSANRPDPGQTSVPVGKGDVMTNPNPDPGEEYAHVNVQLFNQVIPDDDPKASYKHAPYNTPAPLPTPAPMSGFVTDYINHLTDLHGTPPTYDQYRIIMDCFPPQALPVLSGLARNYAVCDRWFSAVPSQTWCNRAFVASATSNGLVNNEPYVQWLLGSAPTIFNRIEERPNPDLTWKIYFDPLDIVSLTRLTQPTLHDMPEERFAYMDDFYNDIASGTLPSYSFVEPRFMINENDMHPPSEGLYSHSSVLGGEALINEVYQKIRHSDLWEKTMLIITFDEHGGCYDHVAPPAFDETPLAVPPDPDMPKGQHGFCFDRLGVRVPSIVISAHTEKGTVDHTIYDHTSIIKTISNRWSLESLTERDKAANDLSGLLNRDRPRDDFPEIKPRPVTQVDTQTARSARLSTLQKAILILAAGSVMYDKIDHDKSNETQVEDMLRLIAEEGRIAEIHTVGEAIDYLIAIEKGDARGCLPRFSF